MRRALWESRAGYQLLQELSRLTNRWEVEQLVRHQPSLAQLQQNHKLIVKFRSSNSGDHGLVLIDESGVESVRKLIPSCQHLEWPVLVTTITKQGHQCFYFLRDLRRFNMSPNTLTNRLELMSLVLWDSCVTQWVSGETNSRGSCT